MITLAPVPQVDNRLFVPKWERKERERLDATRCTECKALPPNHRTGCTRVKLPDPAVPRHRRCGYPKGSLGCRMTCGSIS